MFFTRLPWWRLHQPQPDHFRHVVEYWPLVGWLTGGVMALVYWLGCHLLPLPVAALLALGSRVLLTGALHEDGLADFCDGMGGGSGRERILAIMKDSHIGTYGVVGLIFYFLFFATALTHVPFLMILFADVWGKSVASLLIFQLPYARDEEHAKNRTVYSRYSLLGQLLRIVLATVPIVLICSRFGIELSPLLFVIPIVVEVLLALWMKCRIGGYTGDCCGATFLLCEACIYLLLGTHIKL